jgi:membrane protein implicated in regulation of membrane protease activity
MKVRQVRALHNILIMGGLCGLLLWVARAGIVDNLQALAWSTACGGAYGLGYWYRLRRRISRTDRRYERNKIFVRFISPFEVVLLAAASSHYLLIAILVVALIGLTVDWLTGRWWSLVIGSFGLSGTVVLSTCILLYERAHGPIHYHHDTRTWSGEEGMLYQLGEVVEPLAPKGRIRIHGELWNAVSLSGETIQAGERVEVIGREGLTLKVDRL